MNDLRLLTKQNHLTLLITKESTSLESDFNIFQDFTLFLIKYAFVLTDSIQDTNSSKPQFLLPGELFSQNSNGARYLDPKYSRWISVDPALGEYVPSAGKSNEANKLPGMGGIFNSVNLSLYHYAGNNPIKYVDPDGRTNYIFYDPASFEKQAQAESSRIPVDLETKKEAVHVYGGGVYYKTLSVQEKTVMIPITTEQEFIDAWNNMENPTDVTLIFHGSVTTLNIDYKNVQYLTTNPEGTTPKGNPATYIGNLKSKEIGTLKIYSCQGGNLKEEDNVAKCFKKFNTIDKLYASDGSLSFKLFSYEPKVSNEGKSEYKKKYGQDPVGLVEIK